MSALQLKTYHRKNEAIKMKRFIVLLLVLCMAMTFCACGMEKQTLELNYGEEQKIELKKEYDVIKWVSSDEKIATVSNGTVKATAPGEAVLTADKDGKAVAEITVSVKLIDITAILFSQKNIELEVEENIQQQYTLLPDNASDYGLSWKSANTDIAEVDTNGNIRGVAPGTTTIVCSTSNGIMDTCEVVVKEPSAIEQLNEDEKWLFDVMVEKFLPSFYNAPAARIRKIEDVIETEDHTRNMFLAVNIQGTNKMGGTLFKDYTILCEEDISKSVYLPCFTKDGLFDRSKGNSWVVSTKLDPAKINAALEEYWDNNIH